MWCKTSLQNTRFRHYMSCQIILEKAKLNTIIFNNIIQIVLGTTKITTSQMLTNLLECEVSLKSFIDFVTNVALNSTNWLLTVIVLSRTPSWGLRLRSLQLLFRSWISFVDYPTARFCLTHISLLSSDCYFLCFIINKMKSWRFCFS